jgi:hypothetical protein
MAHVRRLIFLYLLTGWIVFVAIRIEVLNSAAGNLLPRLTQRLHESKGYGGSGKWRASWMTQERWKEFNIRDERGEPTDRPLTAEEEARMKADVKAHNAYARLHDFLSDFGWILQYLAVFVVIVGGCEGIIKTWRSPKFVALYAAPVFVAVAAGVLAVYRGYYSSILVEI